MSTYMPKAGDISREWYVLDADGRTLGEVAAEAATLLRGKHKPTFARMRTAGITLLLSTPKRSCSPATSLSRKCIIITPGISAT